jgi:myo-inositol-1(or 4)-monophosphatase
MTTLSTAGPRDSGEILKLAEHLARLAGACLVDRIGAPRSWLEKGDNDFVTDADAASAKLILSALREQCPGHGIICEDSTGHGGRPPAQHIVWIVDPLDGTTNYLHRYPAYCVSICCYDRQRDAPIASVVYEPDSRRLFAARGWREATLQGSPVHVTQLARLEDCLVLAGMSHRVAGDSPEPATFARVSSLTAGTRRSGCAALDLCFVAAGMADAYFHWNLKPWDVAAGAHIIRNAGGHVTDIGQDSFSLATPTILATNGAIHDVLQRVLGSP